MNSKLVVLSLTLMILLVPFGNFQSSQVRSNVASPQSSSIHPDKAPAWLSNPKANLVLNYEKKQQIWTALRNQTSRDPLVGSHGSPANTPTAAFDPCDGTSTGSNVHLPQQNELGYWNSSGHYLL